MNLWRVSSTWPSRAARHSAFHTRLPVPTSEESEKPKDRTVRWRGRAFTPNSFRLAQKLQKHGVRMSPRAPVPRAAAELLRPGSRGSMRPSRRKVPGSLTDALPFGSGPKPGGPITSCCRVSLVTSAVTVPWSFLVMDLTLCRVRVSRFVERSPIWICPWFSLDLTEVVSFGKNDTTQEAVFSSVRHARGPGR